VIHVGSRHSAIQEGAPGTQSHNISRNSASCSFTPPHHPQHQIHPHIPLIHITTHPISHTPKQNTMSSLVNALRDLVTSLVELVWSFFTTAGGLVQKASLCCTNCV
jgi:hypothetical protein